MDLRATLGGSPQLRRIDRHDVVAEGDDHLAAERFPQMIKRVSEPRGTLGLCEERRGLRCIAATKRVGTQHVEVNHDQLKVVPQRHPATNGRVTAG